MTLQLKPQQTVVVVGAGWDQTPIIQEARRQGHRVVAVDGNPHAHGFQYADKAVVVSTRDLEGVLGVARDEQADALTYMITESPMPAIRYAADSLGLPGPSHKSVEATVSKVRMRDILADAGVPAIRYGKASTLAEAKQVAETVGFPSVMKSADVGGQLGLFRLHEQEDVAAHFAEALHYSVGGEVIIEEWLEGPEVNGVAIVLDGKIRVLTVSDRIKDERQAFGIVQRHLFPSACSASELTEIHTLCQETVHAMEIGNGIIFPQMILTQRGPILVETGERVPGGVMKELFEYATGYDLVRLQLDISLGQIRDLIHYKTIPVYPAVTVKFMNCEPGPLRPGVVATMTGRNEALARKSILEAQFYNDPTQPQEIRPLRHARDRFFFIIAAGDSRAEVVRESDHAAELLDFLDPQGQSLKLVL
jgi:biotin carboxylase